MPTPRLCRDEQAPARRSSEDACLIGGAKGWQWPEGCPRHGFRAESSLVPGTCSRNLAGGRWCRPRGLDAAQLDEDRIAGFILSRREAGCRRVPGWRYAISVPVAGCAATIHSDGQVGSSGR